MPLKEHLMHATAVMAGGAMLGCGILAFANPWWGMPCIPLAIAGWLANRKAHQMFEQRNDRYFKEFQAKCKAIVNEDVERTRRLFR